MKYTHIAILLFVGLTLCSPASATVPTITSVYANEYSIGAIYAWTTDILSDDAWVMVSTSSDMSGAVGSNNASSTKHPRVETTLSRNTVYYYQVYSKNGSDTTSSSIISFKTSNATGGFKQHMFDFFDSGEEFSLWGSTTMLVQKYEEMVGAYLLWMIMISMFFMMYWIRQENVLAPTIIGLIGAPMLMPLLPPEADVILIPLLAVSSAGLLYQIIKAR